MSTPAASGTHTCGGTVTGGSCAGCGADNISPASVKGAA